VKSLSPQPSYHIGKDPQSTATIAAVRRILQGPLQYKGPLPESVEEMLQLVASRSAEVTETLKMWQDFATSVAQAVSPSMSTAVSSARKSDMSGSALAAELQRIPIRFHEILGPCKHERPQPHVRRTSPTRSFASGETYTGLASGTVSRDRSPAKRQGHAAAPVLWPPKPVAQQAKEESDNAVSSESSDNAPPPAASTWVYRRAKGRPVTPVRSARAPPPATKQKEDPVKGPTREGRLSGRSASFLPDDPRTPRSRSHCDGMRGVRARDGAGSRTRGRSASRGRTERCLSAVGA
jgi:hypothetical protein